MPFPYAAILKRAYDLTRNNFQVWVFGIFLSFASGLNFLMLNLLLDAREIVHFRLAAELEKFRNFLDSPWLAVNVLAGFLIVFLSALSKAAVIWSGQKLAHEEQSLADQEKSFSLQAALANARKFVWPVLVLQILLFGLFLVVAAALALPVVYLVALGEIGRTVALTVLGLAILVPASILLGFLFLYSPVFAVLYKVSARTALGLSLQLVQNKLKESLIMAAFLAGLGLAFMTVLGFGIILVSVPVAFLSLVFAQLGLPWATYLLIFITAFLGLCSVFILSAGLAVFNNFVWVLTVLEMVKTEKTGETKKALVPEAEPAA